MVFPLRAKLHLQAWCVLAWVPSALIGCGPLSLDQGQANGGDVETTTGETKESSLTRDEREPDATANATAFTNSIEMKLRLIPAGQFTMVAPSDKVGSQANERQHQVTISKPFSMGIYEVTQAQYSKVMGKHPSRFQGETLAKRQHPTGHLGKKVDSSNHPVDQISWKDAVDFCRRLSSMPSEKAAGRVYRLPTEAEWAYACRAGSTTTYHHCAAESALASCGWYGANSGRRTHAVGQKNTNAWGLYDMHGNVWEWCQDFHGNDPQGGLTDPRGPASGSRRVIRGGSWLNSADGCRSASRDGGSPSDSHDFIGFRVACSRHCPASKVALSWVVTILVTPVLVL